MNAEIRIQRAALRGRVEAAKRSAALATTTLLVITGLACFGASPEAPDPALSDPLLRAERIEELKQSIDRDHATLEDLITQPRTEDGVPLHDNQEIRVIAARLTEEQNALDRLEAAAKVDRK
jgi:hypothetical protein